jgi:OFA family oxalate/formate antiporter-like MFS transporter
VNRWVRLGAAVIAMIMIANLQYAWTLFVKPIIAATHWKLSDVQWGFTLFIAFETWAMPCSGWLIDLLGARVFISVAGVMCGIGWASLGGVHSLGALYAFYSLAGFGAALVYCGSMGVALKWFPDKRGLAAGTIAAGFGAGAALFIPAIAHIIRVQDYQHAFLYTGVFQGLIIICAAQFLGGSAPSLSARAALASLPAPRVQVRSRGQNFNSLEMLRTPQFYVLFAMALMMGIGGLMATAQVGPMAGSFKIGATVLTIALTVDPLANGGARVFWGWISDFIGRERAMFVAFLLQSLFLIGVVTVGRLSPILFVVSLALVYFTWGEVYSLFPSVSADFFGARNASSNYSFIYAAKGVASILGGGLAAKLFEKTGSWNYGFYVCAALALCAAVMSLGLRAMPLPMKKRLKLDATAVEG